MEIKSTVLLVCPTSNNGSITRKYIKNFRMCEKMFSTFDSLHKENSL